MNTEQFKHFSLAYRLGSFAQAAAQVPMSPQGLAKSIHSLEQELGASLFEVNASGVRVPTEYAHRFMGFITESERQRELLQNEFDRIRSRDQKKIRIASSLGISGFLGTRWKNEFEQGNPDIKLEIREMDDLSCDAAVRMGKADFGFALKPFDPRLVSVLLFDEPFYLWVNKEHPLSCRSAIRFQDLEGQAVSAFGHGIKCDGLLQDGLEASGVSVRFDFSPEIYWHYENALLNRSLGLTVEHFIHSEAFSIADSVVPVLLEGMTWSIGLSYLPSRPFAEHEKRFMDFVTSKAAL